MLKGKIELLKNTNMIDFAVDMCKILQNSDDAPQDLLLRRAQVIDSLMKSEKAVAPMVKFLSNPELVEELQQDKEYNLSLLYEKFKFTDTDISALYHHAKLQFECGNYSVAAEFLDQFRQLSNKNDQLLSATWGRLASAILMQDFEGAMEDLMRLKDYIDNTQYVSHSVQLVHRTWLLHWSLFVFFNHVNGRNAIIDLFLQERYLNTIQTTCPHLIRYVATAVICNKRRRNMLRDVVRIIQQDKARYEDPVTQFIECLCIDYDFDAAEEKLAECGELLMKDFFLVACRDEFVENGRLYLFEHFCRINRVIDIKTISERLHMDEDTAQSWIINLIKSNKLNAKIDAEKGTIMMTVAEPDIHEQIIEKTRHQLNKAKLMAEVLGA